MEGHKIKQISISAAQAARAIIARPLWRLRHNIEGCYFCRMSCYRRAFVPGGCWFFTVNLLDRRKALLIEQIEALRARSPQRSKAIRSTSMLLSFFRTIFTQSGGCHRAIPISRFAGG